MNLYQLLLKSPPNLIGRSRTWLSAMVQLTGGW